ncbi:hypothetical protein C4N21_04285 [Faecalibacterium prausnitzii]|uniref:Uncharacterized protein n=1 Tax=Faecalibacterium prausnitzii TaxID=853 RepID=A0A329UUN5_9FIRM|nr:hypothetical protein [Faecalibacterium prausnitzii]RAW66528.1 hypothetical protein C4N21_04285 [Faecalibacterium prausnitzii]
MNNQKDQQMKQAVYFIDDEPTDMRSTEVSSNSMQTVIPNSIPRTTVQKQSDSQHSNCTTTVPANKYVRKSALSNQRQQPVAPPYNQPVQPTNVYQQPVVSAPFNTQHPISQDNPIETTIQKLQAKWVSDSQKAYREKQFKFDNSALAPDSQGCLLILHSNGINTVGKPFSPCRNLQAQKIIEHDTKKGFIKYTFDTPTGEHRSVIVDADCSALQRYNLLQDNGFIVDANLPATICAELIARYTASGLASIPPQIKYSPGWYFSEKHWGFQESEWVDLNAVLLSFTVPPTPDMILYQLVSLYAILQERLPSKMWIRRPICILTHEYLYTDLCIDSTPYVFKKALESLRDRPIVWIRSENINFNESSSAYSRDKNYQALMNSTQSNQKHPLYMVVSSNLTPRQRTFCLPIQDFIDPYEATNSIDSIGGLINSIMNNANAFNSTVERSFTKVFDDLGEDCSVQREIAALSMIADVVKWHYSMQVPPQTLSVRCDEYLETYTRYWERINDGNILTPFRNALYAARRSDMICFRPLEDVDSSFECQKEILYDDTYYYTSTALLKKIIKVQLRSYMPSDVLNRLKTAGVLSGSVPKTLTFAPNESKDFRFRTLLRSSLHQPGSRDLVEI